MKLEPKASKAGAQNDCHWDGCAQSKRSAAAKAATNPEALRRTSEFPMGPFKRKEDRMKAIRLPAILIAIVVLVVLLASCEEVQAQTKTAEFTFPPIGTVQKVTDYVVKATTVVLIYSWAYKTNGQEAYYGGTAGYIGTNIMISKAQLDQQFVVSGLSNVVLYNFCTNADPTWDKSRGVVIYVGCDITKPYIGISQDALWYSGTIQLIKNSDGSYSVPNLSSFSTQLGDPMPIYVPNLQWARVEVGYKGDPYPFEVDDNLYDPGSSPLSSDGFVYLDTSYITNSSSSNGAFWMKISLFDGTNFQIFDGDGNQIPETPMVLGMMKNGTNAVVTVNGGNSGRGYVLQWSSDLKNWTNSVPYFISPQTNAPAPQFLRPFSSTNKMFFRTATTNLPPTG
jgi:hypothetical protein